VAPEFNALRPIRKPALRHPFVPESAIRHTQGKVERRRSPTPAKTFYAGNEILAEIG
jgi:hypothetical protein